MGVAVTDQETVEQPAVDRFPPGTAVGGFRILRLLGVGGMGTVYLARDVALGRRVALKFVRPDRLGSKEIVDRFLFEARTTATFSHPHIVSVYSVGEHEGLPYVALEYLEGESLKERLEKERPSVREALRIGHAIADALSEAHGHGILHRDLKPENVLLPRDGRLRVVDFGLAKRLGDEPPAASTEPLEGTETTSPTSRFQSAASLLGTPAYMAPEQWMGVPEAASDVWALGLLLCELLAGTRPYQDLVLARLPGNVCGPQPVPVPPLDPDTPPSLQSLITRCLAKDQTRRPEAAEIRDALAELLSQRGSSLADEANPFRGLAEFTERDASLFFGRDAEVAAFLERLREQTVVPVVGPSGAGKSSFVQAGVVPRLKDQARWLVVRARPGAAPFQALAAALATPRPGSSGGSSDTPPPVDEEATGQVLDTLRSSPGALYALLLAFAEQEGARVLLVLDALEELFTLCPDVSEQHRFLDLLQPGDPEDPVRIVFTLRDDFLGRAAEGAGMREVLSRLVVMRRPEGGALRQVLEQPVSAAGHRFEDGLVERMLAEVQGEPVCLPLLQFAASQLWERRDRTHKRLLTATYEELGGVAGSLARHADSVLEELSPAQVALARALLLRLVTPSRTRCVLSRKEALEGLPPEAEQVLERLAAARLLSVRRTRGEEGAAAELELAHESLIHRWNRLARWVETSHEELALVAELRQAAELWRRRGRKLEDACQGDSLADARRLLARVEGLPEGVREYIAAGERRERRAQRRRRNGFLVLGVLAAVLVSSILHFTRALLDEKHNVEEQRALAELARADELREGADSARERGEGLKAAAKLRSALETVDGPRARAAWHALQSDPRLFALRLGLSVRVALSPDGHQLGLGCGDGRVLVIDLLTLTQRSLGSHTGRVSTLAFFPDATGLATYGADGELRIWDLASGQYRARQIGPSGPSAILRVEGTAPVVFRERDQVLERVDGDGAVERLAELAEPMPRIAFAPDGRMAWGERALVWVRSGEEAPAQLSPGCEVSSLAFLGADRLAVGCAHGAIRVLPLKRGEASQLSGHTHRVVSLVGSADGTRLVSSGQDDLVRVWRLPEGTSQTVLNGALDDKRLVLTEEGDRLAVFGVFEGAVEVFDLRRLAPPEAGMPDRYVGAAVFSPSGERVFAASGDGTLRAWDVKSGRGEVLYRDSAGLFGVAVEPSGSRLATSTTDGRVVVLDAETGRKGPVLQGHVGMVWELAFSPEGALASVGEEGTLRVWDVQRGAERLSIPVRASRVCGLSWGAGGSRLAVSGNSTGQLSVFDSSSGRLLDRLKSSFVGDGVAFQSSGRWLAEGSQAGLQLWSLERRAVEWALPLPSKVNWLAFSPDERLLGLPLGDGSVRLVDVAARTERTLAGHREGSEVNSVRFSPDGALAVSAGDDGTVRLWDVATGRPVWWSPGVLPRAGVLVSHRGLEPLRDEPRREIAPSAARALESARQVAEDASGARVCLVTHEGVLEQWSLAGERVFGQPVERVLAVATLGEACVTLTDGVVRRYRSSGEFEVLEQGATCLGRDGQGLLVGTDRAVSAFDAKGNRTERREVPGVPVAVARLRGALAVGLSDGTLHLLGGATRTTLSTTGLPAASVVALEAGPSGTVVAGFGSGHVALFETSEGTRLFERRLHGAAVHLSFDGSLLHAVSELGDRVTADLRAFTLPRCDLMRWVWSEAPAVWERGGAVLRAPPDDHLCATGP